MTTADRNGPSRHDKAVALLADHHHELSDFTKWPFVLFHKDGRRFTPLESFTVNFLPRDELLAVLAEALDRAAERRDAWERLAELAEPTIPEWRELTVAEVIARFPVEHQAEAAEIGARVLPVLAGEADRQADTAQTGEECSS